MGKLIVGVDHALDMYQIERGISGMRTDLPKSMLDALNARVTTVAEHAYTIMELLNIAGEEAENIERHLSELLLLKQIKDNWESGRGVVLLRGVTHWAVFKPLVYTLELPIAMFDFDDVPSEWRRQLGVLKLYPTRGCVYDCGYKENDNAYYLLPLRGGE